jgi:hypothetical protein
MPANEFPNHITEAVKKLIGLSDVVQTHGVSVGERYG